MYYKVLIKSPDGDIIDKYLADSYEKALFTAYNKFPADIMPKGWSVVIVAADYE